MCSAADLILSRRDRRNSQPQKCQGCPSAEIVPRPAYRQAGVGAGLLLHQARSKSKPDGDETDDQLRNAKPDGTKTVWPVYPTSLVVHAYLEPKVLGIAADHLCSGRNTV